MAADGLSQVRGGGDTFGLYRCGNRKRDLVLGKKRGFVGLFEDFGGGARNDLPSPRGFGAA